MLHAIRHALTRVGEFTTHPLAFTVVAIYAVAWVLISPETFGWAAIATLATWLMTLFINRTEHRDTQALHAKLDELLRTHKELGPTSPCSMIKTSKILRSIVSDSASGTCKSEPPPRSRNLRLNWRSAFIGNQIVFLASAPCLVRYFLPLSMTFRIVAAPFRQSSFPHLLMESWRTPLEHASRRASTSGPSRQSAPSSLLKAVQADSGEMPEPGSELGSIGVVRQRRLE
jgi:Low affinity iron permease